MSVVDATRSDPHLHFQRQERDRAPPTTTLSARRKPVNQPGLILDFAVSGRYRSSRTASVSLVELRSGWQCFSPSETAHRRDRAFPSRGGSPTTEASKGRRLLRSSDGVQRNVDVAGLKSSGSVVALATLVVP